MPGGGSKKGQRRGGRAKGTPNKVTVEVKAALLYAYDKVGGNKQFAEWAAENLTEFYRLYVKLLPTEIKNADGEPFRVGVVEEVVSAAANDSQDG